MRLRLLMAFWGFIIFIISACGPEPQLRSDKLLQETGFISGEPCAAPCWRGITPGETTWNDAIAIIQDDPTLDKLQTRADGDQIGAAWAQSGGDGCCQMFTEENGEIVSFIVLQIAPTITLGEVLAVHGEPRYLIGEAITDKQGLMTLFYPDVPMLIYAFVAGEEGGLTAESEIVGVGYMSGELMQLLIDSTTPGLYAWEGYQTYQYYMNGELAVTPSITMTPSD